MPAIMALEGKKQEFKVNLGYTESSRSTWAIGDLASRNKNKAVQTGFSQRRL